MILELREEFGGRFQTEHEINPPAREGFEHPSYTVKKFQRIWFDIPLLNYPHWFTIQNAGKYGSNEVRRVLAWMEENVQKDDYLDTFEGFKPYELLKVKRDLAIMEQPLPQQQAELNKITFYQFITEYDDRRGTDFRTTFPELSQYYTDCMKAYTKGQNGHY
jgi:hypothetical protein